MLGKTSRRRPHHGEGKEETHFKFPPVYSKNEHGTRRWKELTASARRVRKADGEGRNHLVLSWKFFSDNHHPHRTPSPGKAATRTTVPSWNSQEPHLGISQGYSSRRIFQLMKPGNKHQIYLCSEGFCWGWGGKPQPISLPGCLLPAVFQRELLKISTSSIQEDFHSMNMHGRLESGVKEAFRALCHTRYCTLLHRCSLSIRPGGIFTYRAQPRSPKDE